MGNRLAELAAWEHQNVDSGGKGAKRVIAYGLDGSGNPVASRPITASTITSGRKSVTASGTAERIVASSTPCTKVLLNAALGNTNPVVVGGSTVVAANGATQQGLILIPANPPITIEIDDAFDIYVDAQTNGDTVCFAILS